MAFININYDEKNEIENYNEKPIVVKHLMYVPTMRKTMAI